MPNICDSRLEHLDIGFWTKVPVTSDFAARAMTLYLEAEHAFYGFFDAELFLSDLASLQKRHCSTALVNAVLYNACVRSLLPHRTMTLLLTNGFS